MGRIAARALLLLAALPFAYLAAALLGGAVPANWSWREPEQGVTIFVQTNGVHTWIAVPAANPVMDWRPLVPSEHVRDPRYAGDYVAIGYGNREFYLNTPHWADLTFGRAVHAMVGNGATLMHVYHERAVRAGPDRRAIVLSPGQYRRLAHFMEASFARDAQGRTVPLIGRGYGPSDMFYEARGGYNALYTCNEWSGAALRAAGVRVGIWTPFSQSIMWRF